MSAAERMRQWRARRKAAGLKAVVQWRLAESEIVAPYSPRRVAEARSLAMHTVIAQRLLRDPGVLEKARQNLTRWARTKTIPLPLWIKEWESLLERPSAEIAALLSEFSERGARLRQSSPFAGVLSESERQRIYDAFRA